MYLFFIITFLFMFIYLEDPSLCQDLGETTASSVGSQDSQALATQAIQENVEKLIQERLKTLERIGQSDLDKLKEANNKYNSLIALYKEAMTRPERDNGLKHLIEHEIYYYFDETKRCINKFRLTEEMIRILKPRYVSHIPKQ